MTTILIIEDTPANIKLATIILEAAGYTVVPVNNALDGIAQAHTILPDLILMDIQLPDMDGLTATRLLKSDAATCAIPIIAMTAFAMIGDEAKMLAAGCDGYLAKPFCHKEFVATVANGLALAQQHKAGEQS